MAHKSVRSFPLLWLHTLSSALIMPILLTAGSDPVDKVDWGAVNWYVQMYSFNLSFGEDETFIPSSQGTDAILERLGSSLRITRSRMVNT